MSTADGAPLVVHGWRIYAHPLFLDQLELLITEVEALRREDPQGYGNRNPSKRLAAITRLMLGCPASSPLAVAGGSVS